MPDGRSLQQDSRIPDSASALTFDDVLIRPGPSDVLPNEVQVASRVTRSISVNIPILSSAMDTVTEGRLAIAMAQAGGIGVIHRNLDADEQADAGAPGQEVRIRHGGQSGHDQPRRNAGRCAGADGATTSISGIPVVENGGSRASWSASSPTATCASPPTTRSRSPS